MAEKMTHQKAPVRASHLLMMKKKPKASDYLSARARPRRPK